PSQFALLCAICEVSLPGDGHLFRNIARAEVRVIQSEWFDICVGVAQKPTRFDAWKKRAADAGLQRSAVEAVRRDFVRGLRRAFPVAEKLAVLPFLHRLVLDFGKGLISGGGVIVGPNHWHVSWVA